MGVRPHVPQQLKPVSHLLSSSGDVSHPWDTEDNKARGYCPSAAPLVQGSDAGITADMWVGAPTTAPFCHSWGHACSERPSCAVSTVTTPQGCLWVQTPQGGIVALVSYRALDYRGFPATMVGVHGRLCSSLPVLVQEHGYTQSQETPHHSGALTRAVHTLSMENPGVEPHSPTQRCQFM